MAKFKVGDRVVAHTDTTLGGDAYLRKGEVGTVMSVGIGNYMSSSEYGRMYHVRFDRGYDWDIGENNLRLEGATKESTDSMSLIDRINELNTSEPLKSFVKYGIKTRDGKLTAEGAEVLLGILADKHEAELVKVTDALAAADEADKKK